MSCSGCKYKKGMMSKIKGQKIPFKASGKCIRPGGFCNEMKEKWQLKSEIRDDDYLEFIRHKDCLWCGDPGPNDPHHVGVHGDITGGKVTDFNTVPLCRKCHNLQEAGDGFDILYYMRYIIKFNQEWISKICRYTILKEEEIVMKDIVYKMEKQHLERILKGEEILILTLGEYNISISLSVDLVKRECDHEIGQAEAWGCVFVQDLKKHGNLGCEIITWNNYCPKCGENLDALKAKIKEIAPDSISGFRKHQNGKVAYKSERGEIILDKDSFGYL